MTTILICGSRWCPRDREVEVRRLIARLPKDTVVIHGDAPGIDTVAGREAKVLGFDVRPYPAHWRHRRDCPPDCAEISGKRAGPLRNQKMLDVGRPDLVIAFPAPHSVGTWDMVRRAEAAGVPVELHEQADPS